MSIRNFAAGAGIAAALALTAGTAQAADPIAESYRYWSWYFEITAGGPLTDDYDATVGATPGSYDPDDGFGVAGELGAYFNENMRAGLSLGYFTAGDGNMTPFGPHTGDVNVFNVMANIYYEFHNVGPEQFTPWVGAGLGIQVFDYDGLGLIGGGFTLEDSDTTIAGALHAGFDYALTERVDLVGRYSAVFVGSHDVAGTPGGTAVSVDSHVDHVLMGGLRFKFNSM